ncbi:HIT family protein [Pyruvatibacter sp.]
MQTLIHNRVSAARDGSNPYVVSRLASGWAVIGDVQFLEGYCLLLPDPVVASLNDLSGDARGIFLRDMALLGDAILEATGAQRINYEILGNSEPALHAHVFPRFDSEPAELRAMPVWFYDWAAAPVFSEAHHGAVRDRIKSALQTRL